MWNVRAGGWPFSLRVEVPDDPGGIFPAVFGKRNERQVRKNFFDSLCYSLNPADFEIDEEPTQWYLFEEDFEDNVDVASKVEGHTADLTAGPLTLIELIQLIDERAHEEDQRAFVALRTSSLRKSSQAM